MPKISVLMPVYRTKEAYLREAIESILNQTFTDFEFLILDDCPEDDREAVVKSYRDARIKYYKNEQNLGISPTRNKLVALSKGIYLAVFDHDDISLPTRLEKEAAFLDAHPDVGVVSSNVEHLPKNKVSKNPEHNLEIKRLLMLDNVVAHTAMMVRKSVLEMHNIGYEALYSPAEDYMICVRLIKYTMFYNIQDALVKYRNSFDNTSHIQKEKMANGHMLCRCFAAKEYPYLYQQISLPFSNKKSWIYLFGIVPFLKFRIKKSGAKCYLFGLFPLFKVQGCGGK